MLSFFKFLAAYLTARRHLNGVPKMLFNPVSTLPTILCQYNCGGIVVSALGCQGSGLSGFNPQHCEDQLFLTSTATESVQPHPRVQVSKCVWRLSGKERT